MKAFFYIIIAFFNLPFCLQTKDNVKVFDVHVHGSEDVNAQLVALEQAGVYKAAISSSWNLQNNYRDKSKINLLYGLMFPCPNGKVPYSMQPCFEDGKDWPTLSWVETQIKEGKINFLGEVLSQYYGISSSDSLLFPYYALAEKYNLPVGIHTGGAGPNHGSPNFKMEMGNPLHLEKMLTSFPKLKVWIMHSGDQFYKETISILHKYKNVYTDISVISNPDIVPPAQFKILMKAFIEAGLEDRLMFGTDNGNVVKVIAAVNELDFLTNQQKEKIFYINAEDFFNESR